MAAIIMRRKWTRQPSGEVEADLSHPALAGAFALHSFAGALTPQSLIAGGPAIVSAAGSTRIDDRDGIGALGNSSTRFLGYGAGVFFPTATPFTAFAYCRFTPGAVGQGPVFSFRGSGGTPIVMCAVGSNGATGNEGYPNFLVRDDVGTIQYSNNTAYSLVALETRLWVVSRDESSNIYTFAGGACDDARGYPWTKFTTPVAGSITTSACGYSYDPFNSGLGSFRGTFYYGGVTIGSWWDQAQTEAIAENPWQLFRPRTRRLYFGAAATSGYTLTAASGSLVLTGESLGLLASRRVPAAAGSFTLTGESAALKASRRVGASQGSFALTGESAATLARRRIGAAQGGFTLTGESAGILARRLMPIGQGAYILTGEDATLTVGGNRLAAAVGSFALSGSDAGLIVSRRLASATGSYALTGEPAKLLRTLRVPAAAGSFGLTGEIARLLVSRRIGATDGVYLLTGGDTSLIVGGAGTFVASTGAFALTGSDAALLVHRRLPSASGILAFTGEQAALIVGRRLTASGGAFSMSGIDVGLRVARVLRAQDGTFTLTGIATALVWSGRAIAPGIACISDSAALALIADRIDGSIALSDDGVVCQ